MFGFPDPIGPFIGFALLGLCAFLLWPFMKIGEKIIGKNGTDTTTPEANGRVVGWAVFFFVIALVIFKAISG